MKEFLKIFAVLIILTLFIKDGFGWVFILLSLLPFMLLSFFFSQWIIKGYGSMTKFKRWVVALCAFFTPLMIPLAFLFFKDRMRE